MNPPPDIQHLMALDALGEATPEQRAELKRHLAKHPELAEEHAAACRLAGTLEQASILASPPPAEPVPPVTLAHLEEMRMRALSNATAAKAHRSLDEKISLTALLAGAAMLMLLVLPAGWWLVKKNSNNHTVQSELATASPALAPRGETGMTEPTLVWENAPGQNYNVWILPEGANQETTPALFVANDVRSPVPFSALKPGPGHEDKNARALRPGTPYLALVCLSGGGRLAGVTVPFHTAPAAIGAPPEPSNPETVLVVVRQLIDAGRASDALMVLAGLPENVRTRPDLMRTEAEVRSALKERDKR
jgi:hypothetical protein